jgi:hypothetical protein
VRHAKFRADVSGPVWLMSLLAQMVCRGRKNN